MASIVDPPVGTFIDRRGTTAENAYVQERRQFANNHVGLSPDAQELARAIDQYKMVHRRRFITFEEMLSVIQTLGYQK